MSNHLPKVRILPILEADKNLVKWELLRSDNVMRKQSNIRVISLSIHRKAERRIDSGAYTTTLEGWKFVHVRVCSEKKIHEKQIPKSLTTCGSERYLRIQDSHALQRLGKT